MSFQSSRSASLDFGGSGPSTMHAKAPHRRASCSSARTSSVCWHATRASRASMALAIKQQSRTRYTRALSHGRARPTAAPWRPSPPLSIIAWSPPWSLESSSAQRSPTSMRHLAAWVASPSSLGCHVAVHIHTSSLGCHVARMDGRMDAQTDAHPLACHVAQRTPWSSPTLHSSSPFSTLWSPSCGICSMPPPTRSRCASYPRRAHASPPKRRTCRRSAPRP